MRLPSRFFVRSLFHPPNLRFAIDSFVFFYTSSPRVGAYSKTSLSLSRCQYFMLSVSIYIHIKSSTLCAVRAHRVRVFFVYTQMCMCSRFHGNVIRHKVHNESQVISILTIKMSNRPTDRPTEQVSSDRL